MLALCALAFGCGRRAPFEGEAPAPQTSSPSSAPISWAEIAQSYASVRDYTCLYEKQERAISNGEKQTIRFYFRKPFDVRCDWLNDRGRVDQTAIYRAGENGGKVLARRTGPLGSLFGTLRLDPNDPLALADSRHPVTQAGIGYIIERVAQELSRHNIKMDYLGEDRGDGRALYKFALTATGPLPPDLDGAHHAFIWVDEKLRLPVAIELYDASGALIERHRFKDMRVNVGLDDRTFAFP